MSHLDVFTYVYIYTARIEQTILGVITFKRSRFKRIQFLRAGHGRFKGFSVMNAMVGRGALYATLDWRFTDESLHNDVNLCPVLINKEDRKSVV